jgi:hypothetical protein
MPFDFDIDLDNLYCETWFGDAPGKKVCLRLCPPDKVEEFRKQCVTPKRQAVLNPETRRMELADVSDFDADKFNELLSEYQFVGWDLKDVKGKEIAFTSENRKRLMQMPRFIAFITECVKELAHTAGLMREEELKN